MRLTTIAVGLALLLALSGVAAADWEAGVAAFKAGNYRDAATHFQEVIDQQPELFQGYLMLGHTLLKDKQAAKAVGHLRKALELNAGDLQTELLLSQALYQTGKYREVVQVLASSNPASLPKATQAAFYSMRGGSYQQIGQLDRAVADLAKAAQLEPSDANAQFVYGTAALKAGDVSSAIGALEKAVRLDSKDAAIRKTYVQALVHNGRVARGAEKDATYQKAVAAAQALVSAQPNFDNLLLLGEVQLGAKSYDAAIDSLNKASGMKSSDWLPYFYIGQAYTAKGQLASAEPPLKTALQRANAPADQMKVWNQLGFVYEKLKRFDEAIAAYQKTGNQAGEQRVAENKQIDLENKKVEEHNRQVDQLEKEAKALEEELKSLPGGSSPPH